MSLRRRIDNAFMARAPRLDQHCSVPPRRILAKYAGIANTKSAVDPEVTTRRAGAINDGAVGEYNGRTTRTGSWSDAGGMMNTREDGEVRMPRGG